MMKFALRRICKTAALVSTGLLLSLSSVQADVTPQSVNGFAHFSACLNALLSNSAEHAQFCAPGIVLPSNNSGLGGGGGGNSCPGITAGMIVPPLALGERVLVAGPSIDPCTGRCTYIYPNAMLTAPAGLAIGDRILVATACD